MHIARVLKTLPFAGSLLDLRTALAFRFSPDDRARKETKEYEWQRDEWAALYSDPTNQRKVLEYWGRFRHLDDIRSLVPIDDQSVILDVGCGLSTVLHYLPGQRCGVDPLAERYKTIYQYPADITIYPGYGEAIPFSSGVFDLVFCSNCIDHTASPVKTIAEIWRVLKPGGHFVLTCEVFSRERGSRDDAHPYSMTLTKLCRLVKRFTIVAQWDSPWIGLRNYVLSQPGTLQREYVLLLRKA